MRLDASVVPSGTDGMEDSWRTVGLQFTLKMLVLILMKECISNKTDELASKSMGTQKKVKSFLLPCPLCRLPAEDVAQIKGVSSHLKGLG